MMCQLIKFLFTHGLLYHGTPNLTISIHLSQSLYIIYTRNQRDPNGASRYTHGEQMTHIAHAKLPPPHLPGETKFTNVGTQRTQTHRCLPVWNVLRVFCLCVPCVPTCTKTCGTNLVGEGNSCVARDSWSRTHWSARGQGPCNNMWL